MTVPAPTAFTPPRPSCTTITINAAGDATLTFVAVDVSADVADNPASPHTGLLVSAAADASNSVFDVPTFCKRQETACSFLLDPTKPWVLLNTNCTGGGKTHVTQVVGVCLNGIIIIITPLLTLLADQMAKSLSATSDTAPLMHITWMSYSTNASTNTNYSLLPLATYKSTLPSQCSYSHLINSFLTTPTSVLLSYESSKESSIAVGGYG